MCKVLGSLVHLITKTYHLASMACLVFHHFLLASLSSSFLKVEIPVPQRESALVLQSPEEAIHANKGDLNERFNADC